MITSISPSPQEEGSCDIKTLMPNGRINFLRGKWDNENAPPVVMLVNVNPGGEDFPTDIQRQGCALVPGGGIWISTAGQQGRYGFLPSPCKQTELETHSLNCFLQTY